MIANITSGSDFYGVANYNQKKVEAGQAKVIYSEGFLNTHPQTIANTLDSYNNSRTKKPVFHVSLSYSEQDKPLLTDRKLLQIAKDYLNEMGYGKQPFVLYRHDDTKHPHVHIITTRVDIEKGKRLPAYNEGRKSKTITDNLEVKYGLTISDKQQNKLKHEIIRDVQKALESHRPENVKSLNRALQEIGSAIQMKDYKKGMIYYKTNENGKRISKGSRSGLFKDTGAEADALENTFRQNMANRSYVAKMVRATLPDNGKISQEAFLDKLQTKHITPVFHEGKKGIYGMGYTYKGYTYKASELDRSLSFGKIKHRLDIPGQEDVALRNALVERLGSGERIKMDFKNNRVEFDSGDENLNKQLGKMDQYDAITLAKRHNNAINNSQSSLHVLLGDYGDEVDEFLRKRRKHKRKQGMRM